VGLAGWFAEAFGAPLWMPRTEFLMAHMVWSAPDEVAGPRQAEFFRRHGMPDGPAAALRARGNPYRRRAGAPPPDYVRIRDGDAVEVGGRNWRVLTGGGHAPEQACLHCEELGLLISADQVLPHITPNVSVLWSEPDANPLSDFLASAARFAEVPGGTRVLPSHGLPFTGLHARLEDVARHHEARLAQVAEACAEAPRTAYELLAMLFRRAMDEHHLPFAMGEAISHIAYLEGTATLRREEGRDGVLRFRRA
jgi:glyoxylase-like metal-dependent hydrolase (beta-lactamase superfamily II)